MPLCAARVTMNVCGSTNILWRQCVSCGEAARVQRGAEDGRVDPCRVQVCAAHVTVNSKVSVSRGHVCWDADPGKARSHLKFYLAAPRSKTACKPKQRNKREACLIDSIPRACSSAEHSTPSQVWTLPITHPYSSCRSSSCRLRPAAWQLRHINRQQREELPVQLLKRTRPPHRTATTPIPATARPSCLYFPLLLCCWGCWCRTAMGGTFTASC
jgi:hypothetical protein